MDILYQLPFPNVQGDIYDITFLDNLVHVDISKTDVITNYYDQIHFYDELECNLII